MNKLIIVSIIITILFISPIRAYEKEEKHSNWKESWDRFLSNIIFWKKPLLEPGSGLEKSNTLIKECRDINANPTPPIKWDGRNLMAGKTIVLKLPDGMTFEKQGLCEEITVTWEYIYAGSDVCAIEITRQLNDKGYQKICEVGSAAKKECEERGDPKKFKCGTKEITCTDSQGNSETKTVCCNCAEDQPGAPYTIHTKCGQLDDGGDDDGDDVERCIKEEIKRCKQITDGNGKKLPLGVCGPNNQQTNDIYKDGTCDENKVATPYYLVGSSAAGKCIYTCKKNPVYTYTFSFKGKQCFGCDSQVCSAQS